jgi:hypothetical protein
VARSVVGSGAGITVVGTRRFGAVWGRVVRLAAASRVVRSWGSVRRALARLAAASRLARSWGPVRRPLARLEGTAFAAAATGWAGSWSRVAGEPGVAH